MIIKSLVSKGIQTRDMESWQHFHQKTYGLLALEGIWPFNLADMEPVTREADVTSNTLHSSKWSSQTIPGLSERNPCSFYHTASLPCYVLLELEGALCFRKVHLEENVLAS